MAQLLSEKEKRIEEKKNVAEKGEEMLKIKIKIGNQIIILFFFSGGFFPVHQRWTRLDSLLTFQGEKFWRLCDDQMKSFRHLSCLFDSFDGKKKTILGFLVTLNVCVL